ncbi:hypothetical protein L1987_58864 [Smallanthus sonchifolius]|uniref:Uncharacterized protein n=1 Tax=Smallanthus sonchifolius TaxID=185202 RepID=A0ACB9D3W3_9ASTR|nr:hypothetical protein L1987_58864 [Smallanthus sonchifolius]
MFQSISSLSCPSFYGRVDSVDSAMLTRSVVQECFGFGAVTIYIEIKKTSINQVATGVAVSVGQHDRPPSESRVATRVAISVGQHGISALENEGLKSRYEGDLKEQLLKA